MTEEDIDTHYRQKKRRQLICRHCGASFLRLGGSSRSHCYTCFPLNNTKASYLLREYDLSWDEWQAMYFDQDGKCFIDTCLNESTTVDHDHKTGKVRALLCTGCNSVIGFVESDGWLKSALAYLEEYNYVNSEE